MVTAFVLCIEVDDKSLDANGGSLKARMKDELNSRGRFNSTVPWRIRFAMTDPSNEEYAMKLKFVFATLIFIGFSLAPSVSSAQGTERQTSQPTPTPPASAVEAQQKKSPWLVEVTLVEKIKPGTENEPRVNPGETVLKVGIKFQYSGPDGDIPAPVAKVTDGSGKEYIMLGNLQGTGGFACFEWLMSASHAVFNEKPKSLASSTIAKCKDAVFYYYFLLPENPKEPLALVFGDAKPLPLVVK